MPARAIAAGTALGVALLAPGLAVAQAYPRLHIVALAQRTDRTVVEPGGIFHVTIHVKITQRRDRIDELILGAFENCEIISNETVRTAEPDGTDFVERLTVQALAPGDATITPAYVDAIDPARGRPMRYSSNGLLVRVTGPSPVSGLFESLGDKLLRLSLAVAIVVGLVAAVFVIAVVFVRRKRRPEPPLPFAPAPPLAPPVHVNTTLTQLADAYRHERSHTSLARVRAALFERAGAPSGATLVDALRLLRERDAELRGALLAAERAMFGPAAERDAAGDGMLAAIGALDGVWTR